MALDLTLACGLYDRTMSLQDGSVSPEGIRLNFLPMNPAELFRRQARHAEFDVSEFSMSTFCHLYDEGDRRLVAIPVFPSRKFRHSEMFISTAAGIGEPKDLAGKRVGAMEYQQTASVWQRGHLQHDHGVRPSQVEWYFGGYNEPETYTERVPITLPSDIHTTTISNQQCLDQMLERGEIDALIGASAPRSFRQGSPNVARLFPKYWEVEADYYRRTGIFPIMHTVVMKREVYERAPWVAVNLYKAFEKAKTVAMRRLPPDHGPLFCMLPWLRVHLDEVTELMGPDPFAYGLEQNRHILETFVDYCFEQGITSRRLNVDDLFAPETHGGVRIDFPR